MIDPRMRAEAWKRGLLEWKLHKGQRRVYEALRALPSDVREAVILISRRWGKSYLGVVMALEDCLRAPGAQVFIVGPNLKQTRKIITPLIAEIAGDAPHGLIKQTKSELLWQVGESTLMVGAFDTAVESFRGLRATSIYLEESGLANPEDYEYILNSVLRPTLMHSRGRIIHLTTPAIQIDHPLHTHTIPKADTNGAFHKYTIYDNPLLTPEQIDQEIEDMGGLESTHCRRELLCELIKDEQRLIVPEFEDRFIKPVIIPPYTYFLTAVDFGGVRDNHAILLGCYDFERNKRLYVDEVWLDINTGTEDIVKAIHDLEQRNGVVWLGDGNPRRVADAPGQVMVDLRRMGLTCTPPVKGKDSVEDGIQALRVAFKQEQIEIDPKCRMLIQTLKHGMWDERRKDFLRTKALGHCDMIAAMSYHFRHQDIWSNPIPPNLGLHRHTHYFEPQKPEDIETALEDAFSGD